MRARTGAVLACGLFWLGALASSCATKAEGGGGPDCAFRSKCPTEIARTKTEIDACNAEKADAKCGSAFSEMESCTQANEECLPSGKVNHAKLDVDCKSAIAAYRQCRPGGVTPDASAGD